jgi:hypothetical protein
MKGITKGQNARYIYLSEWLAAMGEESPKGQTPWYNVLWYMYCGGTLYYGGLYCGTRIIGTKYYGDLYCGTKVYGTMYYDRLYCGTKSYGTMY